MISSSASSLGIVTIFYLSSLHFVIQDNTFKCLHTQEAVRITVLDFCDSATTHSVICWHLLTGLVNVELLMKTWLCTFLVTFHIGSMMSPVLQKSSVSFQIWLVLLVAQIIICVVPVHPVSAMTAVVESWLNTIPNHMCVNEPQACCFMRSVFYGSVVIWLLLYYYFLKFHGS